MRIRMLAPVALLTAGLAACTSAVPLSTPTPTPTFEPRAAAPVNTAAEIVGTWTLVDPSDGMSATITLRDSGMWEGAYECGGINGEWASLGDAFLAMSWGGDMGCIDNIDPQPSLEWVEKTERIVASEDGWTLTDAAGAVTGSLTGGTLESEPPQDEPIQPLPQGFTVGHVEGRWAPIVETPGDSYVEFGTGVWQSSDGCNGNGGRWVDLGGGYLLATPSSISTMIGCENVPVAEWVGAARTAGFDDEQLVLFDSRGVELGRLIAAT
ncbi:hypothetical protein M2152_001696 [Microbacteriaceae bacterium SG_E_30_P1]|uniref:META domain-containing protein n=1 Tax=Antiquaquibacter oligotrophicus TaxID=2880260 RepID=A0ABT6KNE3_9MICO|nr:hypothetical protein [Antiquaquibacter oligotrophicus]MDH6181514.1 hypothetical protein [Antiquaquibacter oligotrophicus]UDF12796.1 hypothetical protein LH407_11620 [Antiquaquibacter oligotrophicus]